MFQSITSQLKRLSGTKGKKNKPKVLDFDKGCNGFTPLFMANESQGLSEPLVNLQ